MDLFFERLKTERDEWPKMLVVDIFPENVRWQCWHIWERKFTDSEEEAKIIVNIMTQHIGLKYLAPQSGVHRFYSSELEKFFIKGLDNISEMDNVNYAFSVLELMCQQISYNNKTLIVDINKRLRLGGIGYKFINNKLFSIQDEHLNDSCIVPAITLLNNPEFSEAYEYVKKAYDDLRGAQNTSLESAVDNIQKAAECLLKKIFSKLDIPYGSKDTYMPLIQKAADNNLLLPCNGDKLNPLLPNINDTLKRLGEIRNKIGGHGKVHAGITDAMSRLAINHAMADMLYIMESYNMKKNQPTEK